MHRGLNTILIKGRTIRKLMHNFSSSPSLKYFTSSVVVDRKYYDDRYSTGWLRHFITTRRAAFFNFPDAEACHLQTRLLAVHVWLVQESFQWKWAPLKSHNW